MSLGSPGALAIVQRGTGLEVPIQGCQGDGEKCRCTAVHELRTLLQGDRGSFFKLGSWAQRAKEALSTGAAEGSRILTQLFWVSEAPAFTLKHLTTGFPPEAYRVSYLGSPELKSVHQYIHYSS